jgi:hypothetical protein
MLDHVRDARDLISAMSTQALACVLANERQWCAGNIDDLADRLAGTEGEALARQVAEFVRNRGAKTEGAHAG